MLLGGENADFKKRRRTLAFEGVGVNAQARLMPHCFPKGFEVLQRVNPDIPVSFTDDGAVKSLGEILGPALAEVTRRTGSAAALMPIWARVVGPVIAPHTRLVRLEGGRLEVRCDAPAWRDALKGEGPALVRRLNAALGEGRVRELVFVVA